MNYFENKKWFLTQFSIFVALFLIMPFLMFSRVSAASSAYLATPFNDIPGTSYTANGNIIYDFGVRV